MTRAEEAKLQIEDPAAYEHKDTSPKGLIIFFASLFAGIVIVMAITAWLWPLFATAGKSVGPFPLVRASQIPPEPRIEVTPGLELWALRAQEDSILKTYGWVDRKTGTLRIPIGRAMDIIAQRGLPYRTGARPIPARPSTGPESGGPQTGQPAPRFKPAQPGGASR